MLQKRFGAVWAVVGCALLVLVGLTGCGKKDETVEAAPPPSANAVPVENAYSRKNMPGPAGRQTTGAKEAPPGTPTPK